jgi:hypothetical protein
MRKIQVGDLVRVTATEAQLASIGIDHNLMERSQIASTVFTVLKEDDEAQLGYGRWYQIKTPDWVFFLPNEFLSLEDKWPTMESIIRTKGVYQVYRSGLACALTMTEFEFFWGHIGLSKKHSKYGQRFVIAAGVRLFKVTMKPLSDALDNLWWLGFEGSRPNVCDATFEELAKAADFLANEG